MEKPAPGRFRYSQRRNGRCVVLREDPGKRGEITTMSAQLVSRIECEFAARSPSADEFNVNFTDCRLVPASAAAVRDGLVERREVFERWRLAFPGGVAQVFIEPAVGGAPSLRVRAFQPLPEPL